MKSKIILLPILRISLVLVLLCPCASTSAGNDEFYNLRRQDPYNNDQVVLQMTARLDANSFQKQSRLLSLRETIETVALQGGAEFTDPNSYQSRALQFLEDIQSPQPTKEMYIRYYAIACIYTAASSSHHGGGVSSSNKKHDDASEAAREEEPKWFNDEGWMTDTDYCTWHGLVCNSKGLVERIDLSDNNLHGTLAPEVQLLAESVTSLIVAHNPWLHSDSAWMANMKNLQVLSFPNTRFAHFGIPSFLSRLTNLNHFDCSNTLWNEGPIRGEAIEGLHSLRVLNLSRNLYTSPIPSQLSALTGLEELYLDNVVIQGDNSLNLDFAKNMTGLVKLHMSSSGLTGTIPSEIGSLNLLTSLDLCQNDLVGAIPMELENLPLQSVFLEGNPILKGEMPEAVCNVAFNVGRTTVVVGADCELIDCSCCDCCGIEECANVRRQQQQQQQ